MIDLSILPNFDFERIARLVLGKAWRKATKEQRTQFKYEFKNLLLRTYAVALSKYKNQKIEYKPMRMKSSDKIVTVKTEIVQSGAQPISVDYALAKQEKGWLVIDIIIEGVSLVTNYRSQFASEIRRNGMDSLIKALAKKNESNELILQKGFAYFVAPARAIMGRFGRKLLIAWCIRIGQ